MCRRKSSRENAGCRNSSRLLRSYGRRRRRRQASWLRKNGFPFGCTKRSWRFLRRGGIFHRQI
ncbi:MAG: DUF4224 domain-containing protein [Lewinellaceae bacterium]|nr:DUF4224 domain-containing protein [Lewinellaceae bacterium]